MAMHLYSLYNYSSIPVTIGHMLAMPRDYISVSVYDSVSAPSNKHSGVWDNTEAWAISAVKRQDYAAASYDLTERQVGMLSHYVNTNDDYSPGYTCASFAAGCWNTVVPSSYQVDGGILPKNLAFRIQSLEISGASLPSTGKAKSTIAYHTSEGVEYGPGTLSVPMLLR